MLTSRSLRRFAAGWPLLLLCLFALACSSGTTVKKDASSPGDTSATDLLNSDGEGSDLAGEDSFPDLAPEDITSDKTAPPVDVAEDTGQEIEACAGPGEFLCECDDNSDCVSGYCVETLDGKLCSKGCIEDCPKGWACLQDKLALPDPVYICLPQHVYLCNPCNSDDECKSGYSTGNDLCVSHGDNGSFCAVDCASSGECPDSYVCAEVLTENGTTAHQCVPSGAGGECQCSPKAIQEGAKTSCQKVNGYGQCLGERVCNANGLTECSALDPKPEECNGLDDNCDGEVDPSNSLKCITWYYDQDGDGYGIGAGSCECEAPSPNHESMGGDCDDSNISVHPGVDEVCNQFDDDCDGETDESFAEGCETMYYDGDSDGFGDAAITDCRCKETSEWSKKADDCNDANPNTYPGAEELCDLEDNNCDGVLDEENGLGCIPYYLDQDKDGYGLSDQLKCLCGKIGDYTAVKGGDCDDTNYDVHPTVVELCDGLDNDCDGDVDEGEAVTSCGVIAHGNVVCNDGCVIDECEGGYFDLNDAFADGCECQLETGEVANQTCVDAEFLGDLADSSSSTSRTGKIVPVDDSDWFKFHAVDGLDPDGCDTFHVRVRLLKNPNDAYAFDVYRGGCAGADHLCSEATIFEYMTDFHKENTQPGGEGGECPCAPDANHALTPDNFKDDTSAATHQCTSQTADFYVRVFRKPGAPIACDDYQIEFSNGINDG
jgi:hypothetical protein